MDTNKSIKIKNKRGENGRLGCVFVCVSVRHPLKITGGKQEEEEAKRSSLFLMCSEQSAQGQVTVNHGRVSLGNEFSLPIAICAYLLEGLCMKLHNNPFFS